MGYFSLLGLDSLAPWIDRCLLLSMFLHVRIKTKGGEREHLHKDNALKITELFKHFHLPVKISSRMLLVWFISCQILSWIWKRLKASVLPTPLTRNEQKHLPKAAQQRDSAPITNTGYLKLQRAISSTLSLLLMAFPPTTTTPNTWGNTTFFNHTPVASQCILIAADWNSTAHITCQRTDMTWSQDTCILCGL